MLNVECLGCMIDALMSGEIDDNAYNAIFEQQAEIERMTREECPGCHEVGYISIYDPDLMHCPACGIYSMRSGKVWAPFRQGVS